VAALGVVDHALDGTPLYAARGELRVDVDEQRVQCHLCGGWYRALGPTHLARAHGVTADEDRELVGLLPRHALWAPDLIEAHSARLRARLAAEPQLRAAMAIGRALARRGELQREARSRLAARPASLERERQLATPARGSAAPARQRSAGAGSFVRSRSASPTSPTTNGAATATSSAGSTSSPRRTGVFADTRCRSSVP
jgi:hypothetical protein